MREHIIVRDLLTLAAAGLLDLDEQRRVETHLHQCEACRAEFSEWTQLTAALRELPTPQAPPSLVLQTQRILAYAASFREHQMSRFGLALLVLFSWLVTFMTLKLVSLLDIPLARWLDVSSTTVWVAYIGVTWLATAFAVGLLVKHRQHQGETT
jgi:anti-sigma factor RsiW